MSNTWKSFVNANRDHTNLEDPEIALATDKKKPFHSWQIHKILDI